MQDESRIRSEQVAEARRRTLTVQHGHTKKPSNPRARTSPKGHDAILAEVQQAKAAITVTLASGAVESGIVTGRDKYTITLDKNKVIYKHAIDKFVVPVEAMSKGA
jgi:RNA chaperone Hfq